VLSSLCRLLAHRVISAPRNYWVAFGVKRTLTEGHRTGLMSTRPKSKQQNCQQIAEHLCGNREWTTHKTISKDLEGESRPSGLSRVQDQF
jgi:hypothetical protein